jgi:hypothetical protein
MNLIKMNAFGKMKISNGSKDPEKLLSSLLIIKETNGPSERELASIGKTSESINGVTRNGITPKSTG